MKKKPNILRHIILLTIMFGIGSQIYKNIQLKKPIPFETVLVEKAYFKDACKDKYSFVLAKGTALYKESCYASCVRSNEDKEYVENLIGKKLPEINFETHYYYLSNAPIKSITYDLYYKTRLSKSEYCGDVVFEEQCSDTLYVYKTPPIIVLDNKYWKKQFIIF